MRLIRIYTNQAITLHSSIDLDTAASLHVARVLRLKEHAKLIIFNGRKQGEYLTTITKITKHHVSVIPEQFIPVERESRLKIHLGQAIVRGERMDWVMQKATELGVAAITPLWTRYCEVKLNQSRVQKKREHWQKIIIHACEQSGRCVLPILHAPQKFEQWLTVNAQAKLICSPGLEPTRINLHPDSQVNLLIGPEGGLSFDEIDAAQQADFKALSLGPRVLRTETAPIAALSILQTKFGDM